MSDTLPSFPTDEETLALVTAAIRGEGSNRSSLLDLLDMLSGYDSRLSVEVEPGICEYDGGPLYHPYDVIEALIHEVRRLRRLMKEGRQ